MRYNKYESDCLEYAIANAASYCSYCGESTDDGRLSHDDFTLTNDSDIHDLELICVDCINSLGRSERTFNQRKTRL